MQLDTTILLVVFSLILSGVGLSYIVRIGLKRFAFRQYVESYIKLSELLGKAYDTGYYNRVAIIRVENNGGIPKLGHSVYFTIVDEKYSNFKAWRSTFTKWLVDHTAAQLIMDCFLKDTCTTTVDTLEGIIYTLVKQDNSGVIACSIIKHSSKELYLLLATFNPQSKEVPFHDFDLQTYRVRDLFNHN